MAIWDKPADNAGRFGASKTRSYSADSLKCPNCASNLVYDLSHGAMICRNCGGLFDPETLDKVGSFGIVNPEKEYDGTIEVSKEDAERVEIVCNSCGAEIVTDKNTSSTFCAFCGSPALVTRRLTREFKPDYIIPFKFDKEKAIKLFEEHCAGIDHLPKDFKSKKLLSKMTGLYVPTWIISTEVEVNVSGQGKMGKMVDSVYEEMSKSEGRNYSHLTYGKVKFRLKNVPFDGEEKIANRLMYAAEPFDYSELVRFRPEFLQGFFAEKYDEQPLDMTDRIYKRLDKYALKVCDEVTFGYDDFVPNSDASITRYNNQDIKYALLPCWFLSIDYDGRNYQYIVNGQTGKVSGEFPYAKGWETIERTGRRARLEAISWNAGLRSILYLLPVLALGVLRLLSGFYDNFKFMAFIFYHPGEALILAITLAAAIFFMAEILPKILHGREKHDIEMLSKSSSHELAPELGVENYYDPSFPITAYETTKDFVSLETGWKYGEESNFDFKSAMPEAEADEDNGDATDFEKQGRNRKMFS